MRTVFQISLKNICRFQHVVYVFLIDIPGDIDRSIRPTLEYVRQIGIKSIGVIVSVLLHQFRIIDRVNER